MVDNEIIQELSSNTVFSQAVRFFWNTRDSQKTKQEIGNTSDQGNRSSVTGGKQMDGFLESISELLQKNGVPENDIYTNSKLELPGYYRSEKKWDLLIIKHEENGQKKLVAAIELKSQVGPSFGNNFNNRTEEAMGSAHDLWTAHREGAYLFPNPPWVGYLFLLEDCEKSRRPVKIFEPHFEVFPEFKTASYMERYQQFCSRLILERLYSASCFLIADKMMMDEAQNYSEIDNNLTAKSFLFSLLAHVESHYL